MDARCRELRMRYGRIECTKDSLQTATRHFGDADRKNGRQVLDVSNMISISDSSCRTTVAAKK